MNKVARMCSEIEHETISILREEAYISLFFTYCIMGQLVNSLEQGSNRVKTKKVPTIRPEPR